jgi:hypothetical protein
MGRLAMLFAPQQEGRGVKHKTGPTRRKQDVLRPSSAALQNHSPKQIPIFRQKKHDDFDDQSYDLSVYFMFRDDPDAKTDATESTVMSRATTPFSKPPDQQQMIRFDFDPAVSFDLGLQRPGDAMKHGPEPIFFRHSTGSLLTTSLALGKGDVVSESNIFQKKLDDLKMEISSKALKQNPHNEFMAKYYDADRIRHELEMLDKLPDHDDRDKKRKKKALHNNIEIFDFDVSVDIAVDLAIDDGSTIAGYSLGAGFERMPSKVIKSEAHRVSFAPHIPELKGLEQLATEKVQTKQGGIVEIKVQDKIDVDKVQSMKEKLKFEVHAWNPFDDDPEVDVLAAEKQVQDPEVYIPAESIQPEEEQDPEVYVPVEPSQRKDKQSTEFSRKPEERMTVDDELSVNNALAVDRFISAPRLCKGTKSVPSIVTVESYDDDSFTFYSHYDTKSSNKDSVFRPKEEDTEVKDWSRVKSHMDQLPFLTEVPSAGSENKFSASASRVQSYGSPIGVEHFDDKRPWRKPNIILKTHNEETNLSEEVELIRLLKSQVQRLIFEAIPTNINFDKHQIGLKSATFRNRPLNSRTQEVYNPSINELKRRLRGIEATHSTSKSNDHIIHTHHSIEELKSRLRGIEAIRTHSRGSTIRSNEHKIHSHHSIEELKSRLRGIEATRPHSREENREHAAHPHSSVSKLKSRLRNIENNFGRGDKIYT